MAKLCISIYLSALLVCFSAAAGPREEEMKKIAGLQNRLPPAPENSAIGTGVFEELRRMIDEFASLNPQVYKDFLDLPIGLYETLNAQADLYHALLVDEKTVREKGPLDFWGHPFVYGPNNELVHSALKLRYRLADEMALSSRGLRNGLLKIYKLIHQSGFRYTQVYGMFEREMQGESLLSMSAGSANGEKLASRLATHSFQEARSIELAQIELARLSTSASDGPDAKPLWDRFEAIANRTKLLDWRLQLLEHKLLAIQPTLTELKRAPIQGVQDLERMVTHIGRGYRTSVDVSEQWFKKLSNGASFMAGPAALAGEGMLLSDPNRDLPRIFGMSLNGGMEFSNYTLPEAFRTNNGIDAVARYREILLIQYIASAGVTISRIADLADSRPSLKEALGTEIKFRFAQLSSQRSPPSNRLFNTSLALDANAQPQHPLRRSEFIPAPLKRKRMDLENHLWRKFFEAAGITLTEPGAAACEARLDAEDAMLPALMR